jgi:hypothetical protein
LTTATIVIVITTTITSTATTTTAAAAAAADPVIAYEVFLTRPGLFGPTVFSAITVARFVQPGLLILWLLLRS